MKIKEILSLLREFHAPLDRPEETCDTVKCGDEEQECTGIAVTCYVTMDVIQQAREKNVNLIICHEPLFYSHDDQQDWLQGDSVFEEKLAALNDANIVVWRDHDHMHGPGGPFATVHEVPDYIYYGIMVELGWQDYVVGEETKPLWFRIPTTTVESLAKELLEKLNLRGMRIVGDRKAQVSTVYICEHVHGDAHDEQIVRNAEKADVLIPLEIVDWTVSEYVRDAAAQGRGKAILEMGHFNFEELGMKYMLKWLPAAIHNAAPVYYLQSGDSFDYILRAE